MSTSPSIQLARQQLFHWSTYLERPSDSVWLTIRTERKRTTDSYADVSAVAEATHGRRVESWASR
jgi:hypothetical protein